MTSEDDAEITKDNVARAGQAGRETKDKAQEALDAAPGVAADLHDQGRAKAQGLKDKLPGSAGDALAAGQQAMRTGGEQVARRVTRQPLEALMLAGAIGYLIGWAANRA